MVSCFRHLGRADASGAIHGGEGFIQFNHFATDGRISLNQGNREARISDIEGCLDASDACANNQHFAVYWYCLCVEVFVGINFRHGHGNKVNSLRGGFLFAFVNP